MKARSSVMQRMLWGVSLVLVLAPLVCGCQAPGRLPDVDEVGKRVREALGQPDGEDSLSASGTIQAEQVRICSEQRGRIVRVNVSKGSLVRAGQALVILDASPVAGKLAEAEAAVAIARADLAVIRAGPRPHEIAAAEANLTLAEAERDGVLAAWENAQREVESPQEIDAQIAEAHTQLKLAEQAAIQAEAELAREKLIRDQKRKGSIERDAADLRVQAAEVAVNAARADRETAQTMLDWLRYIRNEPLALMAEAHAAEGRYLVAIEGVAVAKAQLDDLLAGPLQEEIAIAEAKLRLAKAQSSVLLAQQARYTLTSPVDGVVLDQVLHGGEVAVPAATILAIADLSQVTLVVYVPVNQIGRVLLGQKVQVSADGLPDRTFFGRVTRIADTPEFTPRNVATKEERLNTFYAVTISLPNHDRSLKPGMAADALF